MHTSVFAKEAIDALQVIAGGNYIDGTYGEGGHADEIAKRGGKVLGIDLDPEQVQKHVLQGKHVVQGSFANIRTLAIENGLEKVDGILLDLGLSMEQMIKSKRGFSYQQDDDELDMRINPGKGISAAEWLNRASIEELTDIFMTYAEDEDAKKIAIAIAKQRKKERLSLVAHMKNVIPPTKYARYFQALRIVVNNEMEALESGMHEGVGLLEPGKRMVIITFHSLEDRRVKLFSKREGSQVKLIGGQSIQRKLMNFERSAHLRILEKI